MPSDSNGLPRTSSMSTLKFLGQKMLNNKHNESSSSESTKRKNSPTAKSFGHHLSSAIFNKKQVGTTPLKAPVAINTSSSLSDLVSHSSNPFSPSSNEYGDAARHVATTIEHKGGHHLRNHRHDRNDHPLKSRHLHKENIIYNPYGINNASSAADYGNSGDLSFYLQDGVENEKLLPLPIADPNSFLPESLAQFSVQLTDNFIFDSDNKTLGAGSSSEVRRVKSAYDKKEIYALKKLHTVYHETPEKFYVRCSKEFIIAKHVSHYVHVANTFYLMKIPTTTYTTRGWGFVMELCAGDLFQLIERTEWKNVPASEKFCIFKQVAKGIKFIHEQGIAHRDIKPENVLMTKDGICKLTDFGISDWIHTDPEDITSPLKKCEGIVGSTPYSPPEVMYYDDKKNYPKDLQKPYLPTLMDSYALGILFFALMNGSLPFMESSSINQSFRDYESSYSYFISQQNKHFRDKNCYKPGPGSEYKLSRGFVSTDATRVAWRLADPQPETRYSMDDLFQDPWFNSIETCIDPDDHDYNHIAHPTTFPQLRRNGSETDNYMSPVSSNSETSLPIPPNHKISKPRSMVDIAQSPNLPKSKHQLAATPSTTNSTLPAELAATASNATSTTLHDIMEDTNISEVPPPSPPPPADAAMATKLAHMSLDSPNSPVPIPVPVAAHPQKDSNLSTPEPPKKLRVVHNHFAVPTSIQSSTTSTMRTVSGR